MDFASFNYLAIVLAAIANMLVAFLWYSPALFGNAWMQEMGLKEKDMPEMAPAMTKGFINSLFIASIFTALFQLTGVQSYGDAIPFILLMWGAVISNEAAAVIWGGASCKFFMIETGFYLVSYLAIAEVLTWLG